MKRCANCKSLMPADAPKCIKCGFASVTPSVPAPPPSPAPAARPALAPLPSFAPGERPGRIRSAWLLAKQSWRVLMLDKQLLVFPLLSGIACLLVLASFAAGVIAAGHFQGKEGDTTAWVLAFIYYFVNYFVIVFFNSALVACAMVRFQGGSPTVGDGLRAASARLPQILAWVLLASTVGIVLRAIMERFGFSTTGVVPQP